MVVPVVVLRIAIPIAVAVPMAPFLLFLLLARRAGAALNLGDDPLMHAALRVVIELVAPHGVGSHTTSIRALVDPLMLRPIDAPWTNGRWGQSSMFSIARVQWARHVIDCPTTRTFGERSSSGTFGSERGRGPVCTQS